MNIAQCGVAKKSTGFDHGHYIQNEFIIFGEFIGEETVDGEKGSKIWKKTI